MPEKKNFWKGLSLSSDFFLSLTLSLVSRLHLRLLYSAVYNPFLVYGLAHSLAPSFLVSFSPNVDKTPKFLPN